MLCTPRRQVEFWQIGHAHRSVVANLVLAMLCALGQSCGYPARTFGIPSAMVGGAGLHCLRCGARTYVERAAMLIFLSVAILMVPVFSPESARLDPTGVELRARSCACGQGGAALAPVAQGEWWVCKSESFCVQACDRGCAVQLAEQCEQWKHRLSRQWLGPNACRRWEVRCVVVLHRSAAAYERAVGGAVRTAGASTLHLGADGVVCRRIDLRGDRYRAALAALPHEMTHVVLADLFVDRPPPAWADEGMATLADAPAKRAGHAADLHAALAGGRCFRLVELLALEDYPPPNRVPVFYAQSASLVQFLAELGGHESIPRFLLVAREQGYDAAVRSTYGLDSVRDLEQRWRRQALRQR